MNVLHVTLSFAHGGRREAIATLARGLAPLGIRSHLCCLDELGADDGSLGDFASAHVLRRRGLFDRSGWRALAACCAQRRIDVVHAHDAASEATCALALPWRRPPLLMTFHRTRNFESARARDRLRNALAGLRTAAIVTATEARRRHFVDSNHVRADKVLCIPLGIDLTRFRPDPRRREAMRARLGIDAAATVVGTVGHFGPEKGVDLAIAAFQRAMRDRGDDRSQLVVLGTGDADQQAAMRARVDTAFAGRVHFAGFQNEPEAWFPGFDVLLHGARDEAFGLVLVEAMACGVPVVAARVGGIGEVVADGRTGRLSEAADADGLAAALRRVLDDPAGRAALADAAVAHVREHFDRAAYASRYAALYRRLLNGHSANAA